MGNWSLSAKGAIGGGLCVGIGQAMAWASGIKLDEPAALRALTAIRMATSGACKPGQSIFTTPLLVESRLRFGGSFGQNQLI